MGCVMNNYEDLAFKPAMTWDELCEYVESKYTMSKECLAWGWFTMPVERKELTFYINGLVELEGFRLAQNRTYEQMKNIIDNLYGE